MQEHELLLKTVTDIESNDLETAKKRIEVLRGLYVDELAGLKRAADSDSGALSKETMESLRQFIAKNSVSIEITND